MSHATTHSQDSQKYLAVSIRFLRAGVRLQFPIFDNRQALLLKNGQIITQQFIQKLKDRGVTRIIMHESEVDRLTVGQSHGAAESVPVDRTGQLVTEEHNHYSDQLDSMIMKSQALGIQQQGTPFAKSVQSPGTDSYDDKIATEFTERHSQSVDFMQDAFSEMINGYGVNLPGLKKIGDEALKQLARDPDLYACVSLNPATDSYPARHSTHVSMVATLIGMRMGLDKPMLHNLAMGCLIHDAGMLKIDQRIFKKTERLDNVEFLEITKHPVAVFDLLIKVRALETPVAMVAYQMHERCDGTGYPRGCHGNKIHPLAKIAAVADVFVALVSDRPHRPGLLPYKAMEKLLLDANRGKYENHVVRTLLECVSLFPIGSYVELSDKRIGKVIRTTGETFSQPIVESWQPYQTHLTPDVINLAQEAGIQILRPLSPHDERLTQTKTELAIPNSVTSVTSVAPELEDNWD